MTEIIIVLLLFCYLVSKINGPTKKQDPKPINKVNHYQRKVNVMETRLLLFNWTKCPDKDFTNIILAIMLFHLLKNFFKFVGRD